MEKQSGINLTHSINGGKMRAGGKMFEVEIRRDLNWTLEVEVVRHTDGGGVKMQCPEKGFNYLCPHHFDHTGVNFNNTLAQIN